MAADQTITVPTDFHLCDCCVGLLADLIRANGPAPIPGVFHLPITGIRNGQMGQVIAWSQIPDDPAVLRQVLGKRWSLASIGYASRIEQDSTGKKIVRLVHRIIYALYHGPIPGRLVVDHIDRNPLNNLLHNLRAVSQRLNTLNRTPQASRTGFTGVAVRPSGKKWVATITVLGKRLTLGDYPSPRLAAAAVNRAYATHFPGIPVPNRL